MQPKPTLAHSSELASGVEDTDESRTCNEHKPRDLLYTRMRELTGGIRIANDRFA
jgi:hypothetical protein